MSGLEEYALSRTALTRSEQLESQRKTLLFIFTGVLCFYGFASYTIYTGIREFRRYEEIIRAIPEICERAKPPETVSVEAARAKTSLSPADFQKHMRYFRKNYC